jgi:hypothetical protein
MPPVDLRFEYAASLRDEIRELEREVATCPSRPELSVLGLTAGPGHLSA